jgi:hypothetical protein
MVSPRPGVAEGVGTLRLDRPPMQQQAGSRDRTGESAFVDESVSSRMRTRKRDVKTRSGATKVQPADRPKPPTALPRGKRPVPPLQPYYGVGRFCPLLFAGGAVDSPCRESPSLCRPRFTEVPPAWGFALYPGSDDGCRDSVLFIGLSADSPEESLRHSGCSLVPVSSGR